MAQDDAADSPRVTHWWAGTGAANLGLLGPRHAAHDTLADHLLRGSYATITFRTARPHDDIDVAKLQRAHIDAVQHAAMLIENTSLDGHIIGLATLTETDDAFVTVLRIGSELRTEEGQPLPLDLETLNRCADLAVAAHRSHTNVAVQGKRHTEPERSLYPPNSPARTQFFAELAGQHGVTAQYPTFLREHAMADLLVRTDHNLSVPQLIELTDAFIATEGICLTGNPGQAEARYTTNDMLAAELRVVMGALDQQARRIARARPTDVDAVLDAMDRRNPRQPLGTDRRAAIRHLACSGNGVDLLVGAAGAGKTKLVGTAREVWGAVGVPVIGTAPTSLALGRLAEQTGLVVFPVATLTDPEMSPIAPNGVLIIDEAGAMGTRTLDRIMQITRDRKAKVVLIGDPHQLAAGESGGALAALADRMDVVPNIAVTRRQERVWERDALADLRSGDLVRALDAYTEHKRIFSGASLDDVRDHAAEEWYSRAMDAGRKTVPTPERAVVMLAKGAARVDDLVRRARVLLKERGHLGRTEIHVPGNPNGFAVGDLVVFQFSADYLDITAGMFARINWINTPNRSFSVTIASGNSTIERVIPPGYIESGQVVHAYAANVQRSEVRRVAEAIYLAGPRATREEAYSAMSRGIRRNTAFVEPSTGSGPEHNASPALMLGQRLARSNPPKMALDVLHEAMQPFVGEPQALQRIIDRKQGLEDRIAQWEAMLESPMGDDERAAIVAQVEQTRRTVETIQRRLADLTRAVDQQALEISRRGTAMFERRFAEFAELDPMLGQRYGMLAEQYAAASMRLANEKIIADHVIIDVGDGIIFEADFIVRGPAGVYIKEVKAGNGSLTKAQKAAHPIMAERGGRVLSGNMQDPKALRVGDVLPPTPVVREVWR